MSGPAAATRASSIGSACERVLFYDRTVAAKDRVAHEEGTQAIFDLGIALERLVVRVLESDEEMQLTVTERGTPLADAEHEIGGHLDVEIVVPGFAEPVPCEIKGLNPYTAESIKGIQDISQARQVWVRKYYDQLQTYLFLTARPLGLFVLLNKSTGRLTFIECPRDEERIAELIAKADRIKVAVRANEPPARHVSDACDRCPFQLVCAPPRDFGPGAQVLDHEELEALLVRREELAEPAAEYRRVDKAAKALLPKTAGEILVGDFAIVGKEVSRSAYNVAASTYVKRDIRRIGD